MTNPIKNVFVVMEIKSVTRVSNSCISSREVKSTVHFNNNAFLTRKDANKYLKDLGVKPFGERSFEVVKFSVVQEHKND